MYERHIWEYNAWYRVDTNVMISLLADNSWLVMEDDIITILQPEELSCSSDFP